MGSKRNIYLLCIPYPNEMAPIKRMNKIKLDHTQAVRFHIGPFFIQAGDEDYVLKKFVIRISNIQYEL